MIMIDKGVYFNRIVICNFLLTLFYKSKMISTVLI